jgi:hypothetical protein
MQTARATAKLEKNWSLAAVARELHCSKTCIFNIKRGWQENRLERPMRIGVGKISLLKFTFTLIMCDQKLASDSSGLSGGFSGQRAWVRILKMGARQLLS